MNSKRSVKVHLLIVSSGWTLTLFAGGFRLPDQDAFATARGEAFVATADNASAIYYNPAGIAQLQGNNFRAGVYGIYLDPSFDPPAGAPNSGHTYDNQDTLHAVPQFFYAHGSENLPLSYGLGIYSPYGLGVRWPQDTGFRTVGTQSSLTYATINPAVAVRLAPNFSIGVGLTVNYANADLEQGLFWPAQSFDGFRFRGEGWGVGYNLGLLWKPHEKVSIGMSFRSSTTIDLKGHTDARNDTPIANPPIPSFTYGSAAHAEFSFPLNAIFGISYRPTPAWNLEFDADYTDWSSMGTVTIQQSGSLPPLIPQNLPVVFEWQPSMYYEFGATRYFGNGWQVSAGYIYNENSVPDAHYTPLVADMDKHFFSVGTGFKGKLLDFDVAYQFGYGPTRTVAGSATTPAGQTADGNYHFLSHALLVTAGMHF